jgi:two-component system, sensor histidine kinase RpfC
VISRLTSVLLRLRQREDSEHEQAIIRMVIAALVLVYMGVLHAFGGELNRQVVAILLAGEFVGWIILAWIIAKPGLSHVRRWMGMINDYLAIGLLLGMMGEITSPLYVLMLWVTIGNGLRFGTAYLLSATAITLVAFGWAAVACLPQRRSRGWPGRDPGVPDPADAQPAQRARRGRTRQCGQIPLPGQHEP